MTKNILTSKIIAVIALIVLAFGQLNTSLAAPAGKSDELINQLAAIARQTNVQKPFSEVIDLTENCAKVMQQEYFEIDEDYINVVLGDKLKKVTEYLSKIAQNNADAYQNKLNELEKQNKQLNAQRDATYAQMTETQKNINELSGQMAGLNARNAQLQADLDNARREADAARAKLNEINEKIKYVNDNWWWIMWIPGYGVYTAVDAKNAESHWESTMQRLNSAEDAKRKLDQEKYSLDAKLSDTARKQSELQQQYTSYEQQMKKCTDEINLIKPQKVQYSNLALFFANTATTFKYNDSEIKRILEELSNMRKEFYTKTTGG